MNNDELKDRLHGVQFWTKAHMWANAPTIDLKIKAADQMREAILRIVNTEEVTDDTQGD